MIMLEIQTHEREEHAPPGDKFVRTSTAHGRPIHLTIVGQDPVRQVPGCQDREKQDMAAVDQEPEGYNPYDHSPPQPPEQTDQ